MPLPWVSVFFCCFFFFSLVMLYMSFFKTPRSYSSKLVSVSVLMFFGS